MYLLKVPRRTCHSELIACSRVLSLSKAGTFAIWPGSKHAFNRSARLHHTSLTLSSRRYNHLWQASCITSSCAIIILAFLNWSPTYLHYYYRLSHCYPLLQVLSIHLIVFLLWHFLGFWNVFSVTGNLVSSLKLLAGIYILFLQSQNLKLIKMIVFQNWIFLWWILSSPASF